MKDTPDSGDNSRFFDQSIKGRCGYIRDAYPFVIKNYEYSKVSLSMEGHNSMLSDIDFYDSLRQGLKLVGFNFDISSPSYFRNNSYL